MRIKITQRKLRESEINLLIQEIKKSPYIGLIPQKKWPKFTHIYIGSKNNILIGICVVVPLKNWVKIGPLVILKKFQNQGYGKLFLQHVTIKHKKSNLYIGSSNPAVWKIVQDLNFQQKEKFLQLPKEIQIYLAIYLLKRLSLKFIWDDLQKRLKYKKKKYLYFLKPAHP